MELTTQQVLEIATEAHKGQKRTDGKDYITHPIEVARIARELALEHFKFSGKKEIYATFVEQIALLHDVMEDCPGYDAFKLADLGINPGVIQQLLFLDKNNFGSYLEMIKFIRTAEFAKLVKIADITHNLSDQKDGNRKDKYELALYILRK